MENQSKSLVPDEVVMNKIYLIRNQKVMLDADLAELYGTETKKLKQQVNRNIQRFPKHYMFELTKEENEVLRSQFVTLKRGEHSKYLPYAFTEHGILMLSNILKSERAISVSIQIIDIFVKLRETLANQTDLWLELERIKAKINKQDNNIDLIFQYLDELIQRRDSAEPRQRIGFKPDS